MFHQSFIAAEFMILHTPLLPGSDDQQLFCCLEVVVAEAVIVLDNFESSLMDLMGILLAKGCLQMCNCLMCWVPTVTALVDTYQLLARFVQQIFQHPNNVLPS